MVTCLLAVIWSSVTIAEDGIKLAHSVAQANGKTCITQLAHNKCKSGYQPVNVVVDNGDGLSSICKKYDKSAGAAGAE